MCTIKRDKASSICLFTCLEPVKMNCFSKWEKNNNWYNLTKLGQIAAQVYQWRGEINEFGL